MALIRPIQGELAQLFWSSANICNRIRAICAYSVDYEDANKNLDRYGYPNSFRKRVLSKRGITFNNPTMVGIPFNNGNTPLDECLDKPSSKGHFTVWDDNLLWLDPSLWVEWCDEELGPEHPNHTYPTQLLMEQEPDKGWHSVHTIKEE